MAGYSDLVDFDGADGWASVTIGLTPNEDGAIDVVLVAADGQPPMTAAQLRQALVDVIADIDDGQLPEGIVQ